jgi:hypothetical protein
MSLPLSFVAGSVGTERLAANVSSRRSSILGRPNIRVLSSVCTVKVKQASFHVNAGFFGNIFPGGTPAGKPTGRAGQLTEELLELAEPTDAGFKASDAVRERIEELVCCICFRSISESYFDPQRSRS